MLIEIFHWIWPLITSALGETISIPARVQDKTFEISAGQHARLSNLGMPLGVFLLVGLKDVNEHRTYTPVERGLAVMGCVLDVTVGLLAGIKRGHPEKVGGIPNRTAFSAKESLRR